MTFTPINEYMLRSKVMRQVHLRLDEPCVEIGGRSEHARLMMAHFLGTTCPSGFKVHMCHACNNDKCSNPRHLYWGTPGENNQDKYDAGYIPPSTGKPGHPHTPEAKAKIAKALKNKTKIKPNNPTGKTGPKPVEFTGGHPKGPRKSKNIDPSYSGST